MPAVPTTRDVLGAAGALVGAALSTLGTNNAKLLPHFLSSNPLPNGYPWGTKTSKNTNYYVDYPSTGVTRTFDWTITKQTIAPDGVSVPGLLVNGQSPGPMIEANWGDIIQVAVTNDIADEGTGIHWHGFLQKNYQAYDGAPGITQCPIAPNKTMTYVFQAELYGTSWWHSHYSSQYASGLVGPIVIYGPNNSNYDIDIGPVAATDWFHAYYTDLVYGLTRPLPDVQYPYSQNILINGKNSFDCSLTDLPCVDDVGLATFNFTSGKTHRLRLINTSGAATLKYSIDGHTMRVIANDFVEVEPYQTDVVTLAVGQRTDVIVTANNDSTGAYYLRAFAPSACATNNGTDYALASIYYEDADRAQLPNSTAQSNWDNEYCGNDALSTTVPYYPMSPGDPEITETIVIAGYSNGTHGLWHLNGVSNIVDFDNPILLQSKTGNDTFSTAQNVYNFGRNSSVRFIIENQSENYHPMHLHGHNIFILAEGTGEWDGTIVNPQNPQRRDVQIIQPGGYLIVQWNQDNPGAWNFHCHIAWHLSLGMSLVIIEDPATIESSVAIPSDVTQGCVDWTSYADSNTADQIDSGV